MGIFIVWLVLSFVVAAIGGGRKIGFGGALILSLLLSPLIGLIVTLSSSSLTSIEHSTQMLEEQKRTNDLLASRATNSISDELKSIQQMRINGTLTEDEYEKLRLRIINGNNP